MPDTPLPLIPVPMPLETERLIIRPYVAGDEAALWASIDGSREHLSEWMTWVDETQSLDDVLVTIANHTSQWALRTDLPVGLFEREGGRHLGGSGLHRMDWELRSFEIGYWLTQSAEGHGYMTECVEALTGFAFAQLHARRVEIRMDPRNARSRAIPQRLGFQYEGTLRHSSLDGEGTPRDTDVFALIRSDGMPMPPIA